MDFGNAEVNQPVPFATDGKVVGNVGEARLIQKVKELLATVSPRPRRGSGMIVPY